VYSSLSPTISATKTAPYVAKKMGSIDPAAALMRLEGE
jgi:hypothetical protein